MGLIDALRRLFNFSSVEKIKKAIDGLSDEERYELLDYIEGQVNDVETTDPDLARPRSGKGSGWY